MSNLHYGLPLGIVVLAVALVYADEPPRNVNVKPIPKDPVVASRMDLSPRDFTQKLEGAILVPSEEDFEVMVEAPIKTTIEMVYVPGGEFLLGSPEGEEGRNANEGPQVKVKVRPFWMSKTEITWAQFDIWWKNASIPKRDEVEPKNSDVKVKPDAITRPTNPYVDESYGHSREGTPAICMSHHSAMMYCHWLRLATGYGYRLPTEAEWEYACRAGSTGPRFFDDKKAKLTDYAWFQDNVKDDDYPEGTTKPVGTKKPNKFGLYDMYGNVAEWCLDQYDPKAYQLFNDKKLTLGPVIKPTEKKWSHVVRGGSWKDQAKAIRSAARTPSEVSWMGEDPQFPRSIWWLTVMDEIGFRVVLPVEEYESLVGLKPAMIKKGQ